MGTGEKFLNQCCAFFPCNIATEIDPFIKKNYDHFYKNFVEFWSSHSTFYPCKLTTRGANNNDLCSAAIICDGHMKIRRRLCANKNVPLSLPQHCIDLFKPLIVGCSHTPNPNQILCIQCKTNNIEVGTRTKQKGIMNETSQSSPNNYANDMTTVSIKQKRFNL